MLQNGDPKEKQGALAALRNLSLPSKKFFLLFYVLSHIFNKTSKKKKKKDENKIKVGDSGILEVHSSFFFCLSFLFITLLLGYFHNSRWRSISFQIFSNYDHKNFNNRKWFDFIFLLKRKK